MRVTIKEIEIWYNFTSLKIKNVYSMKGIKSMTIIPLPSTVFQCLYKASIMSI